MAVRPRPGALAREAVEAEDSDQASKPLRRPAPGVVADGIAAQAGGAQGPRRRRTRHRRQGARCRQDGRGQGAGRGNARKGRRQGHEAGQPGRYRQGRRETKSTPPPLKRTPPRRPRPGGGHRQGGTRASLRWSLYSITLAAATRSSTCGATRISRRRTVVARRSILDPGSGRRLYRQADWDHASTAAAQRSGLRWTAVTITTPMVPRTPSTVSSVPWTRSIGSRSTYCCAPRSSYRTAVAEAPRRTIVPKVRRGASYRAPGRSSYAKPTAMSWSRATTSRFLRRFERVGTPKGRTGRSGAGAV